MGTHDSLDALVAMERSGPVRRRRRTLGLASLVVGVVLAIVAALASLAAGLGIGFAANAFDEPTRDLRLGPVSLTFSAAGPPLPILVAAVLALVAIALGALAFEGIAALLAVDPRRRKLAAYRRVRGEGPQIPGPVRVTVLIPAHDEEATLPVALAALREQARKPERVIVIADRCTDGTLAIARSLGAEVIETIGNEHKKAGALNQVLARLLPGMGPSDAILVMDADTAPMPGFIATATEHLDADPELAAVGGRFLGEAGAGLLGQFQRNEYVRYSTHEARLEMARHRVERSE